MNFDLICLEKLVTDLKVTSLSIYGRESDELNGAVHSRWKSILQRYQCYDKLILVRMTILN